MDDASGVSTDALAARRGLQVVRGRQERLLHLAVGRTDEIVHRDAMPLPAAQRCPHRLQNHDYDRTAAEGVLLTEPVHVDALRGRRGFRNQILDYEAARRVVPHRGYAA